MHAAAILHDTVEDAECTFEELVHAQSATPPAKQIKIADKVSNIRDITSSPPADWTPARRVEYLDWSEQVVAGCLGVNPALDSAFAEAITVARRALAPEAIYL